MNLKRWAFLCLLATAATVAGTVPSDYTRYGGELRLHGVLGLLGLPSLIAFQVVFALSATVLLAGVLQQRTEHGFRKMAWLLATAAGVYGFSLWLLHGFSTLGMFGWAPAALCFLFLLSPAAAFVLLGVPVTIFYAIRKPSA